MRRGFAGWIGALLAALIVISVPLPAAARVTVKITLDGTVRQALVDPGVDAATTPSPLVFFFHGATQSAADMAKLGLSQAWPEATVVYPEGPRRPSVALGLTITGWQLHPGEFDDQDVRFVDALVKEIGTAYKVDEGRIFATGFSNGGAFSYLLLTMRPERFAAIAPVAISPFPWLKWARTPRPVLITHGKTDPVSFSLAEWTRNQLLRLNGCSSESADWARDTVSFPMCSSSQPVLWSVHNGGHLWPADATANVVRFFKEQRLAAPTPTPRPDAELDAGFAFAGSGRAGFSGDGAAAATAQLLFPDALALDGKGALYVADTGNQRIRKIGSDGVIRSVAGRAGSSVFRPTDPEESPATRASLNWPESVVVDRQGNLFIADTMNRLVRRVTPAGVIRTVAGKKPMGNTIGFSGDDGPGFGAELSFPTGLAIDRDGRLFIADSENHRVRQVTPDGTITTVVGTGTPGYDGDNGAARLASLNEPWGLATDSDGNLFIADASNHRVRKLTPEGTLSTVAGTGVPGFSGDEGPATGAQLNRPLGLAVDRQGNLFIVDQLNYRVRRVAPNGVITTVFGGAGSEGGVTAAPRYYPSAVAVDRAGNLLIADPFNHRIWKVAGPAAPGLIAGQPFP